MKEAVIVDGGGANLASLEFALARLGWSSEVTQDPARIRAAERVLLPGVGSAGAAMERLERAALCDVLRDLTQPVLGICLGMQLLYAGSEEGDVDCLGILDGRARRIAPRTALPVPHMGWNSIRTRRDDALLADVPDGAHFYFVHGYALEPGEGTTAVCDYGSEFTAVTRRANWAGVQFHPERSGAAGARLLENFLEGGAACS